MTSGENIQVEKPWKTEWDTDADRTLEKLKRKNPQQAKLLRDALDAVAATGQPRSRGKGLTGHWAGYWRYRVQDWRIIVEFKDKELLVVAVKVGPRDSVYN